MLRKHHEKLSKKWNWYAKWHAWNACHSCHWTAFAVVVVALFAWGAVTADRIQTQLRETIILRSFFASQEMPPIERGGAKGKETDYVLVGFREGVGRDDRRAFLASQGFDDERFAFENIRVAAIPVPRGANPEAFARTLEAIPNSPIEFAEVDVLVAPDAVIPNDPWFLNWQKDKQHIGAYDAWEVATGNTDVLIAVVDTGVQCTHEDLAERCVSGWNTFDNTSDADDIHGHGTKVAGAIAATGNNEIGIAGTGWNFSIFPIRASDTNGYASYSSLASGIQYAADRGALVVNVSYYASESRTIQRAAEYLRGKGGIVTMSMGNQGIRTKTKAQDAILMVGATDLLDSRYSWSNYGSEIDLTAPGCTGATTARDNQYTSFCGTSLSAPHVAGALALLFSAHPALTPEQAADILFQSAKDIGKTGWDDQFGWGRIDLGAALSYDITQIDSVTVPARGRKN